MSQRPAEPFGPYLLHERIGAGPQQLLRERQSRREADHLGRVLAALDRLHTPLGRNAARQHNVGDGMFLANRDQIEQLRVHGDQVHAEVALRERLRRRNLGIVQVGGHRAARNHPKSACIADCADQIALRDPAHRAAQYGVIAAEKVGPARHQFV